MKATIYCRNLITNEVSEFLVATHYPILRSFAEFRDREYLSVATLNTISIKFNYWVEFQ